ncbi:RDD family protein [Streptomyces sp. P9(2023)]|uniref:RDD family protein n=1 Tax=Streptomyces sp. P9(2023) TaxID=3064394 RepID=UPI0028F402F0|nr:RDD family protein [Streptomyces sp. P9(2023)]MDT9690567.1 RDD family protein [Streptomyces sp. P9(2023)]
MAVALDAALAVLFGLGGGVLAFASGSSDPQAPIASWWWVAILTVALAFSFCNHVGLTFATRTSIGKAVCGLRVVRAVDSGRPRLLQLVGRWLFGFYWMVLFVPLHVLTDSDVEQQDAVGLRVMRRGG